MADEDKKGALNPNAKSFTFNPNASTWAPPAAAAAPPAQSQPAAIRTAQAAATDKVTDQLAAAKIASQAGEGSDDEEPIDETDPLWQVTLRIAGGDRARAKRMLENPDALMAHPEIVAVIDATAAADDAAADEDWETAASPAAAHSQEAEETAAAAAAAPAAAAEGGAGGDKADGGEEGDEGEDAEPEPAETTETAIEEDPREHLNLVFIGHVDAGKSTLSGNILYLTDFVDKRTIERYEREAKQRNRESWFLAYIMDTNEEERAKGKTVEVGRAHFHSDVKRFTILDAPGHNAYVPNMIQGAAQADVGILVISARRGEFETGFEKGGQTREHALLAKTLGVRYLIVVINKMDDHTVNWSRERFDECTSKLKPFLRSCGYAVKKDVMFVPLSGLTGANVKVRVEPAVCPWWDKLVADGENNTQQGTLLEVLDRLHMDNRDPAGPLRCPVLDRYTDRGTIALSKVEQGTLRAGTKVMIMPTKQVTRVEAVYINETRVSSAKTGENVSIKLACTEADVQKGFVVCDEARPCHASKTLLAQIALVELTEQRPIFSSGYEAIFHCHTAEEECAVIDLVSATDKKTGKVTRRPRFAKEGGVVTAKIRLARSVPVEKYDDMPQLGRFTLRTEGKTIAIGKILDFKNE
ncbi:Sup35, eukaryotic translation termination factor eRF3 [Tribonema minus]|uniref:Sup35, eukaryotic translation termination factor eRF3 n=1 Tax=Tribonema minus TaxID=303371 RepID=A0A835YYC4_9STRA|nr:Sup35, eukaryotic translation termination factor eRF3 [Tribonema minus]